MSKKGFNPDYPHFIGMSILDIINDDNQHKKIEFVNLQYNKIQDFVIYNQLYKGRPDDMSHADIVLEMAQNYRYIQRSKKESKDVS